MVQHRHFIELRLTTNQPGRLGKTQTEQNDKLQFVQEPVQQSHPPLYSGSPNPIFRNNESLNEEKYSLCSTGREMEFTSVQALCLIVVRPRFVGPAPGPNGAWGEEGKTSEPQRVCQQR